MSCKTVMSHNYQISSFCYFLSYFFYDPSTNICFFVFVCFVRIKQFPLTEKGSWPFPRCALFLGLPVSVCLYFCMAVFSVHLSVCPKANCGRFFFVLSFSVCLYFCMAVFLCLSDLPYLSLPLYKSLSVFAIVSLSNGLSIGMYSVCQSDYACANMYFRCHSLSSL